ncbi:MAG: hypothetical protein RL115_1999 [Bacteroidota bacterium]|jgi:hypothetical protein
MHAFRYGINVGYQTYSPRDFRLYNLKIRRWVKKYLHFDAASIDKNCLTYRQPKEIYDGGSHTEAVFAK